MNNQNRKKSQRGGRRIHEKFLEPVLIKDVETILNLAKKEDFYTGKSLNIEDLIKSLDGVHLQYSKMDRGLSGSLKNDGEKWVMTINSQHHKNRQRYTMAHELGHFIMHKDTNALFEDTTFFRGADNAAIEYAANEFAASILMPEEEVRSLLKQGIRELGALSDEFKVSPAAMKYRLENLGFKLI